MRIICFFIGHKWSNWKYVKSIGRYDELIKRSCQRCRHGEFYKGMTECDEKGNKVPYITGNYK